MRLAVQSQTLTREGLDFCIRARVAGFKAIGPQAHNVELLWEMKRALPNCKFVFRYVFEDQAFLSSGDADAVVQTLKPYLDEFPYDAVEGFNEAGYYWPEAAYYSKFNRWLAAEIHRLFPKVKYIAYNFGATWPDVAILADYKAGWVASDIIGLHAYKLPQNIDDNTIYHHRQVRAALRPDLRSKPIWFTEFGLDKNGDPGDGWRGPTWGWTPEQYAAWLKDTAKKLTDVELGFIFLLEYTDPHWQSWGILGENVIADAIREVNEERPMPKIYLAIMPSNQDRNASALQPYPFEAYNEGRNMHWLATEKVEPACIAKGIVARTFWAGPESDDSPAGSLSNLRAQYAAAKAWLDQMPADGIKAMVAHHTDSGSRPHTFGMFGGVDTVRRDKAFTLARAIAERVGIVFNHPGPQGVFDRLGTTDYNQYVFVKDAEPYVSVLIELCSHQSASDLATLYGKPVEIAKAIAEGILVWAGQAPPPPDPRDARIAALEAKIAAARKALA